MFILQDSVETTNSVIDHEAYDKIHIAVITRIKR